MENEIIIDIKNYIDFLRNQRFDVSLSIVSDRLSMEYPTLYQYEIHTPVVCSYLKSTEHTFKMCIRNKSILKKSKRKTPYYACCYAGVEEFVIPVLSNTDIIAYINISGYRNTMDKSKKRYQNMEKYTEDDFNRYYSLLSDSPPSMNTIMSFANPLIYMLRELYQYHSHTECHESSYIIYQKILSCIFEKYMYGIDCASIGEDLNYSASYIRYIFKKHSGESIMRYIARMRLEKAKELLISSNTPITAIANYTGFSDSNYFSAFFKRIEKVTPREYRKSHQRKQ